MSTAIKVASRNMLPFSCNCRFAPSSWESVANEEMWQARWIMYTCVFAVCNAAEEPLVLFTWGVVVRGDHKNNTYEQLFCLRHCTNHYPCIISFHPHSNLWRSYYYPRFTKEQTGGREVTCPRPHSSTNRVQNSHLSDSGTFLIPMLSYLNSTKVSVIDWGEVDNYNPVSMCNVLVNYLSTYWKLPRDQALC